MATTTLPSNPRGIPLAPFVEQVENLVAEEKNVDNVLKKFGEMLNRYKYMESHSQYRRTNVAKKVPELKKSIMVVEQLIKKKEAGEELDTRYELNETLYANAKIKSMDKANVMLEYDIEEAQSLLKEKLALAESNLSTLSEDLEFLRLQITTMEVNMARVYNWDVKRRKAEKE